MDYFLKASAITVIFYACYIIFLQRETFFVPNRWFLIFGLVTAVLFPLLVIPIYVEVINTSLDGFNVIGTPTQNIPETFDVTTLLIWIYAIAASFLLGKLIIQLISLVTLIKKNDKKKIGQYTYVETSQSTTPFSFFKCIVYNPKQFNQNELELILQHEKIHAKQMHSMDVLFMDLLTALFWFNPFIWLYRKALKQNLEFIADRDTQKQTDCEESYQKLLLKTSLPQKNLVLINTFYNSTIKKRIVMLHKSKSNLMNSWKYTIIVPLLVVFAMAFNTKVIAQNSDQISATVIVDQQNILKFVVTKDTKDKQLGFIKDKLADKGAVISFNNLKRNSKNEITSIKIIYEYKYYKGNYYKKASDPINPIEISINPSNDAINVGQQISELSQTFDIETTDDGKTTLKKNTSDEEGPFKIKGSKIKDENNTIKDSLIIENIPNNDNLTNTKGEDAQFMIIKKGDQKINIYKNNKNSPLVIFDGKEISNTEINAMSPNTIGSIQVLKDDSATNQYGPKGENGVIVITSKNGGFFKTEGGEMIGEDEYQKTSTLSISKNSKNPVCYVDGKEINKTKMEAINPNTIESINVLKDESATEIYGKKGKNGVVIITLKKE